MHRSWRHFSALLWIERGFSPASKPAPEGPSTLPKAALQPQPPHLCPSNPPPQAKMPPAASPCLWIEQDGRPLPLDRAGLQPRVKPAPKGPSALPKAALPPHTSPFSVCPSSHPLPRTRRSPASPLASGWSAAYASLPETYLPLPLDRAGLQPRVQPAPKGALRSAEGRTAATPLPLFQLPFESSGTADEAVPRRCPCLRMERSFCITLRDLSPHGLWIERGFSPALEPARKEPSALPKAQVPPQPPHLGPSNTSPQAKIPSHPGPCL